MSSRAYLFWNVFPSDSDKKVRTCSPGGSKCSEVLQQGPAHINQITAINKTRPKVQRCDIIQSLSWAISCGNTKDWWRESIAQTCSVTMIDQLFFWHKLQSLLTDRDTKLLEMLSHLETCYKLVQICAKHSTKLLAVHRGIINKNWFPPHLWANSSRLIGSDHHISCDKESSILSYNIKHQSLSIINVFSQVLL